MKRSEKKWSLTSRLYEKYLNKECVIAFLQSRNLSEPQLAAQMNVSYPYLYRVLRGQIDTGDAFISGLMKLGMRPEDIFRPNHCQK